MRSRLLPLCLMTMVVMGCTIEAVERPTEPQIIRISAEAGSVPAETGDRVKVHLRRDSLGMSGNAPVGLDPDGPRRGAFWLEGTLTHNSQGWLTVRTQDDRLIAVPTGQILFVELLEATNSTTSAAEAPGATSADK